MKRVVWAVLVAVCLGAVVARAQEEGRREGRRGPGDLRQRMEMQERQLEMEAREEEMRFQREMHDLELEQRRMQLKKHARPEQPQYKRCAAKHGSCHGGKHCRGLLLLIGVIHILVTIWVYQDIKRRKTGSGLWIVIALIAGLLGAAVYALVRIGDKPASEA